MQRGKKSSSSKTKQNATVSEPTKEGQAQRKSSSSRVKHSAQVNGLHEKGNLSSETTSFNNEEQNKSVTGNYNKENKENGIPEEDITSRQEFTGSQVETAEMT